MLYQPIGPQGNDALISLDKCKQMPHSVLPQRSMVGRRRNAAHGRPVAPSDNIVCSDNSDYPVWLYKAQSREGFYFDFDRQNNGQKQDIVSMQTGENLDGATFVFSRFDTGIYDIKGDCQRRQNGIRSALFIDWCLAHSVNPKTGSAYLYFGRKATAMEHWQDYGVATQPCLGALMLAEEEGQFCLAFCVGAIKLQYGVARDELIYLGLGVKRNGTSKSNQIGLVVFAASAVIAFRLPPHYSPCKEHFKLEYTVWSERFKETIVAWQKQWQMEQADNAVVVEKTGSTLLPGFVSENCVSQKAVPAFISPFRGVSDVPKYTKR